MTKREEEAQYTIGERLCCSYNDVIQAPLQPLMDNLESQTYEVDFSLHLHIHVFIQRKSTDQSSFHVGI